MPTVYDYRIERENGDQRWYKVRIYSSGGEMEFSMEVQGRIEVSDGKITSIRGNARSREDFELTVRHFDAYRVFYKPYQNEILDQLEDIVCGDGG